MQETQQAVGVEEKSPAGEAKQEQDDGTPLEDHADTGHVPAAEGLWGWGGGNLTLTPLLKKHRPALDPLLT